MDENFALIIVIITGFVSYSAWRKPELFNKLLLSPYIIVRSKQYYRMLTYGFVHGNWSHLIVNMLVFLSFSDALIYYFGMIWYSSGKLMFIILYLSAIVVSSIYDVIKYKDNSAYSAVGASGATSAIIFASMLFQPWNMIYFFGIIPIPSIIFGIIYLIYSYVMGQKSIDNIGHNAHFWGAVYGFLFPILLEPDLLKNFIHQILKFSF
jgi:membrane associated rhomboid family serine protease